MSSAFFCAFVRFLKRFNKRVIPITNLHLCTSLHKVFALFGKTGLGVFMHASEVLLDCTKIALGHHQEPIVIVRGEMVRA